MASHRLNEVMRRTSFLCALCLCGCAATSPGGTTDARIDGTSETSFDRSYDQVIRPLSPGERRQFALALFSVLLPDKCLGSDAVLELTFLPVSADRTAHLRSCRTQLDGKSYRDIINAANKNGGAGPPHNNRWRGP
jgi:hypothetical protein